MPVLRETSAVSPVLVGRSTEVQALRQFVDQAQREQGQTVFITGDAGIGKSRLIAETVAYAVSRGFVHLQGNCFQPDTARPYAPFRDLLQTSEPPAPAAAPSLAAQQRARMLAELTALPALEDGPLDLEQHKQRLFDRLSQCFIGAVAPRPLALVIEDIHWSDATSLEFLYQLARQLGHQPVLLLLTYRGDEISAPFGRWLEQFNRRRLAPAINLAPLNFAEVSGMLRAILGTGQVITPEFANTLHTLSDGNPFFVEEALKALITAGELTYRAGGWQRRANSELRIPHSIQAAVQQQVATLSVTAQQVVTLAAVIGRRFDFDLLLNLTELDEAQVLAAMKELVGAQLVLEEAPDRFTFRHALTRQAVYAALLTRERKKLHGRLVQALESRGAPPADLAYHAYAAEDWTRALAYSLAAGEQAQACYAPQTAIEHFTRGQEAAQRLALQTPGRLWRARGLAYESVGEFQMALADLQAALTLARSDQDRPAEWQVLLDLGMLWAGQDYAQTGRYYEQAFELARLTNDQVALGHSLNRVGNWHLNVDHPVEAHWYHQEALAIFEKLGDQPGVAETLDLLGMASYLGGNLAPGTEYYRRAVGLFRELDNRRGLVSSLATLTMRAPTYQTDTLIAAGSLAEAAQDGAAAVQIARETGQRADEAYSLIFLSMCLGAQGDYQQAFSLATAALTLATEINHRQWITAANFALGAIYLDVLAFEPAERYLEQALALARESGSWHWLHSSAGLLALLCLEQNQLERAAALIDDKLDPALPIRTLGHRLLWRARIELALAQGETQLALDALDRLADAMTAGAFPADPAARASVRLLKLRGEAWQQLNQTVPAAAALHTALDIAVALGARPLQWRIHLALARLQRGQQHHRETGQHLKAAQALVDELAAGLPEPSLAEGFKNHVAARIGPTFANEREGLTPREHEVAALLAQGKSNHQIAQALIIGDRTVETHVAHVLSKLGFTSRAQIAAWVVAQGLTRPAQ